jgi:tripeptide aminopeptidase
MLNKNLVKKVVDRTIAIQQIPAPTFAESLRANYLAEQFGQEGLQDVTIDKIGNVFARIPGNGSMPPLILSAHTDTVFPANTVLNISHTKGKVSGPGIGDNSLGVAGLFGLLWMARALDISFPGDIWLVANVGEEGLGDLNGMRAVVDRFGEQPLAYIVLEGMSYGRVYHRGLAVRRYQITARTQGGHSWGDYGSPSAIHALAELVHQITNLSLPESPPTSLNVGVIAGGTSVNTIAAEAKLELDLRSTDSSQLKKLSDTVEKLVEAVNRPGVTFTAQVIGDRPVGMIPATHPLVQLAVRSLKKQGLQPDLNVSSTDANIPLSRGYASICIGLSTGGGAHTSEEYMLTQHLAAGLNHLLEVVQGTFEVLGE